MTTEGSLIAYKAFDENMQCRGHQYAVGETYTHRARWVTRQTVSNWKHDRTHMPQAACMVLAGLLKERKDDE